MFDLPAVNHARLTIGEVVGLCSVVWELAGSGVMVCLVFDDEVVAERQSGDVLTTRAGSHTPRYVVLSACLGTIEDVASVVDGVPDLGDYIWVLAMSVENGTEEHNCSVLRNLLGRTCRPKLLRFF